MLVVNGIYEVIWGIDKSKKLIKIDLSLKFILMIERSFIDE
jgi:hypothetical protein